MKTAIEKIVLKITPVVLALAIVAGPGSALAATHSDFTKSFTLQTLKTFEFKQQHRISRETIRTMEGVARFTDRPLSDPTRHVRRNSRRRTDAPPHSPSPHTHSEVGYRV